MELKQLEAYVKVYELQSFSKAAEAIFVSQPSISAYINSLEKELQTQLIYRSTKEFLPTLSGKMFYEYAKSMLALRDKLVFSLKNSADCTAGNIDILASSVPAQYLLPEILGAFHQLHPNITFDLSQMDTADVVKGISVHKGDIGFVGAKIENSKCLYAEFMSEKLIIIAPYEDRFGEMDANGIINLLSKEYFVAREIGSGTRLRYEELLREIGVNPDKLKISACFNNTQSIIHAVANGLGISIVSELAAKYYIQQKLIMPIDIGSLPERGFYMVLKKNYAITPVLDIFIKFVQAYAGTQGM